jgi:hypothetical protein
LTEIKPLRDGGAFEALSFACQRFALISSSGGGKSYGCGRIVEDLARANVPQVVVDTVGIWPAIRLAADGKSPGLPFVPERAGELARFILRNNASAVVDVSDLMPDERAAPSSWRSSPASAPSARRSRPRSACCMPINGS